MINKKFNIGFIQDKHNNNVILSSRILSVYVANLKHTKINIYKPSFTVSNNLNLTQILTSLGYLQNDSIHHKNNTSKYTQIIHFNLVNNIFVKTSNVQQILDLSERFLFYIRYIPNNIILYIGRYGF
jgi:hypothetical protein